uniref:Phospholipase B-like n=1 Tax=Alexandrium monilatum TaxID=311494 RepID=A0A7S4VGZ1_9DINO
MALARRAYGPGFLALCCFSPASSWEQGAQVLSARCAAGAGGAPACVVAAGEDPTAQATGSFQDDVATTGWGRLLVKTPAEGDLSAFAAGYLEGLLTAERVVQHLTNALAGAHLDPPPAGVRDFLERADAWAREAADRAPGDDSYWAAVRAVRSQLDGLVAGVNSGLAARRGPGRRSVSRWDMLLLNNLFDVDDIKQAVNVSERARFESMDEEAVFLWTRFRGHCSSIVKLLPNASEIFAGHNTWFGYHMMLRIFKRYEFGSATPIAMSSFPGVVASMDDFYQVGSLVIMETTLPNYNNELLARVRPESLPFWVRAMVANRLAKSGAAWMEVFKRFNSGTYNNMWMVVDYGRFTPGKPLPSGVLTVGEQLPGYFHYEDQTRVLSYGYWPSYNAAVYPETARLIKQDVMAATRGTKFSYELVERAQIFRRDQARIESDEDMQRVMRYNRFETDPVAHGDPCSQLACRSDLSPSPRARRAFGAIDAKYTSLAHVRAGRTVVVSGPTHDDQPAFDWRAVPELAAATPHVGQPPRYDFGWLSVGGADLEAAPWRPPPPGARPWSPAEALGPAALGLAVLAAVPLAAMAATAGRRRGGGGPAAGGVGYKRLAGGSGWASPVGTPAVGA